MQLLENRVCDSYCGTGALGRAVVEHFLTAGAKWRLPWVVDAEVPLLEKQLGDRFPASQIHLKKVDVGDEAQTGKFVAEVAAKWSKVDILNQSGRRILGRKKRLPRPRSRNGRRCSI